MTLRSHISTYLFAHLGLGDRFLDAATLNAKLALTGNTVSAYAQTAPADIVKVADGSTVEVTALESNAFPDGKVVSIPDLGQ